MSRLSKNDEYQQTPDWVNELEETKQRWFIFLEKLETRMEELCAAALPELKEAFLSDDDVYKRNFQKLYSGIMGQMEDIRKKVSDTFEEKIQSVYYKIENETGAANPLYHYLLTFRQQCSDRYFNDFEQKHRYWTSQLEEIKKKDYEEEYRAIVEEFENSKNTFLCQQCGSPIPIDKIYFTTVYLKCPVCQTQNTFEPSTKAKQLEQVGRGLAEQRTAPLLADYKNAQKKERTLYYQAHEWKISNHQKNDTTITEQIQNIENERQELIRNTPALYEKYLRAMFDEWNKIVPDLKEQNEKFYRRMLEDFRKYQ